MRLYSFSKTKELKVEEDRSILAFNSEDITYVAECFDNHYMHEIEVKETDIIKEDWYLIDSIRAYYITGGEIISTKYVNEQLLNNL